MMKKILCAHVPIQHSACPLLGEIHVIIAHERKIILLSFTVWEYQGNIGLPSIKNKSFTRIFTYTVKNPNDNDNLFIPFVLAFWDEI